VGLGNKAAIAKTLLSVGIHRPGFHLGFLYFICTKDMQNNFYPADVIIQNFFTKQKKEQTRKR